jgi:hypothetical protein
MGRVADVPIARRERSPRRRRMAGCGDAECEPEGMRNCGAAGERIAAIVRFARPLALYGEFRAASNEPLSLGAMSR